MDERFAQIGIKLQPTQSVKTPKWYKGKPILSAIVLAVILLGCLGCELFIRKDPGYMDLYNANRAPCKEFLFGTDSMGRDIFSMIWSGGRTSIFIGFLSTAVSTVIAILFGTASGMAPKWLDQVMMRLADIILSIPGLLLVIFLQAVLGNANVITISLVLGLTGWTSIAKVVRTEVRQLRSSEYIAAARCMGAGFLWILIRHLAPNFISSILFMVVMNIRSAIVSESTLSFMGLGLPVEQISWGSMLSLSEKAILAGTWWIIVIPGVFLVATLLCVTNIGNYLRMEMNKGQSNL